MLNMLLKQSGVYGMTVGCRTVFTMDGAIKRYKLFLEHCYNPLTPESAIILSDVQNDMVKIGLTWDEVERMENDYLKGEC